jgi:hypothetical protein
MQKEGEREMKIACPRCDHVLSGNECDCGFKFHDTRVFYDWQPTLPLPWPQAQQMQVPQRLCK